MSQSFTQKQARYFLSFVVLLIISAGFLILVIGSSAQTMVVVNGNISSNISVQSTPEPPKSTVRGTIVYGDTGRPVRRAAFLLLPAKGGSGRENSGLTDDAGKFVLSNVNAGNYFVMINAPGVLNSLAFIDFSAATPEKGHENALDEIRKNVEEIIVPEGGGELELYIRAKRGGAIGGRVMYADGAPAIGVKVEVMRKVEDKYVGVIPNFGALTTIIMGGGDGIGGRTDDRGVYRISGLPSGEYVVRVSEPATHGNNASPDYSRYSLLESGLNSLITTFHPEANSAKDASVLNLEIGEELSEVNITIPDRRFFNILGKVVSKGTKQPVSGARVSITRKEETFSIFDRLPNNRGGSATNPEGAFSYNELLAGTYTIKIQPPDIYGDIIYDEDGRAKRNGTPKPKFAPTEKEITITDKDLDELTIELPPAGRVSFVVTADANKSLPEFMRVTATNEKGELIATASPPIPTSESTEVDKRVVQSLMFSFDNLPAGKFFFDVSSESYGAERESKNKPIFYIKSIKHGARDLLIAPLDLGEGAIVEKAQIVLGTDGGRLDGRIREKSEDKPALNRRIVLIPTEPNKWAARSLRLFAVSDGNGQFKVEGAPIEYFVIFLNEKDKAATIGEAWIRERSAKAEKVTIKPNESATVNLTTP